MTSAARRPAFRYTLAASAAAIALVLAACSPAGDAPAATATAPAADPAQTSLVMAADPSALGFDPAIFDKVEADLQAGIDAGVIPGGVFLVAKGGEVAGLVAVGQQGPQDATPVSPETIFRIYSMTKPVVSVAAMKLVEDGKLGVDDPVSKYIPEFAGQQVLIGNGETRAATTEMTVRHLLTHTSGLIYGVFDTDSELGQMYMAAGDTATDITALEQAKAFAGLPLLSDPGARWQYSRSTDVLGAVLEVAAGKTLDVVLDETIFTPLGMTDTNFYLRADQHDRLAEPPPGIDLSQPKTRQAMLSGGGGLNSTTEDYFRFVEMLRNRGEYRGVRIIRPETLDAMLVNHMTSDVDRGNWFFGPLGGFGLGFGLLPVSFTDPSKGQVFSWSGYAGTSMWVDPGNDITMVFMIQNNEASGLFGQKLREWTYGGYTPTAVGTGASQ